MAQAELSVPEARLTPWGNRIEIVGYDNVQFTKAPNVLRGTGLTHLSKNERALATFGNSFGLPSTTEGGQACAKRGRR